MQPCRNLPPSWACRQCHWVCDRAVGERSTTESIASTHKLYRWCGQVHIVHKIHRYAINRNNSPIYFLFFPSLEYCVILSCTISKFKLQYPAQYSSNFEDSKDKTVQFNKYVNMCMCQKIYYNALPLPLLSPISVCHDNFSLSCSLQNNKTKLSPSDWRRMIVSAFEKTYVAWREDVCGEREQEEKR